MSVITHHIKSPRKHRYRKLWLAWHLYLGLSLGLVFALAGLTGSFLVFYVEIDELINPALTISTEQSQLPPQSYENLFQALKKAHPEREGAWRLELPRNNSSPLMARYYKPTETEHLHFAPLITWLNPYTAQVLSSRFWGEYLMTWLYDLHYSLLLDTTGKLIMAIIGGLLLIPLLTGIYLWFPKTGKFYQALTFKRRASAERFIYDVHKLNGVYGFSILLLLILSGIVLELPDTFNPLINQLSPLYQLPTLQSINNHQPSISLDNAVAIALQQYPQAQLRWIETPKNINGVYRIMLYQAGEPSQRFPKTMVWINQYSGAVLANRNPHEQSGGDMFINWLHPLHSGEIAGLTGRVIVFISGFIPLILYVTGFVRWRQKRVAGGIVKPQSNRDRAI